MRSSLAKRLGAGAALVLGLSAALPAQAEWLRAETEHFVIYGDTSPRAIRNYAEKVERFDSLLRSYYPIPVDHEIPKLDIYLARGADDLRRASPGIGSTVAGFYTPTGGRIHAVANVESEMSDDVIFHEYGHHFMFQMASNAYPAWFVEGFAEYYATAQINDDRYQIGRLNVGRMRSLNGNSNDWPPLSDVLRWRISANGRYRGADYYALSWALSHYFLSDPERTKQLGRYLAAVASGGDPVESMVAAVGKPIPALQTDLRRYITGSLVYLTPQIAVPDPEVKVTALTPDEARLAWLDLRLDRTDPNPAEWTPTRRAGESDEALARRVATALTEREAHRAELVRSVMDNVRINPTAPENLRAKARAERIDGRDADALATLEPLLVEGSQDARALRIAAETLIDQAAEDAEATARTPKLQRARAYLSRALEIDPLDFQTYVALDTTRNGASTYPTANDLATLQVANDLAPQSDDVRLRYARALMMQGRNGEAANLLNPIANSPHDGASRISARAMLAKAREAAGLAAQAAEDAPADDTPSPEPS